MRNKDGGIWRLTWELSKGAYLGSVVGHPKVCAVGKTFEKMEERLYELVNQKLQAGEWTADWNPPAPRPGKAGVCGRALGSHVSLGWNGRFVAVQDPGELFTSVCETCGRVTGKRTKSRLRMFIEDPADLCGDFGSMPDGTTVFSRELATAISKIAASSKQVEFRPVERLGKGRKEFVEPVIVGRGKLAQPVALRGEKNLGWMCVECGCRYFYHDWSTHPSTTFHRLGDLPKVAGAFWMANCYGRPEVCVPAAWWKENRRAKFVSGVTSSAIGVAGDAEIDPSPKLKPRTARDRPDMKRRWPAFVCSLRSTANLHWRPTHNIGLENASFARDDIETPYNHSMTSCPIIR